MNFRDRTLPRLALIGVLVAALGLAACGRKGPLDLPPSAGLAGDAAQTAAPPGSPPKKHLPIDVLLN
jgi:predicted small lipoprotein YifL